MLKRSPVETGGPGVGGTLPRIFFRLRCLFLLPIASSEEYIRLCRVVHAAILSDSCVGQAFSL